MKFSYRLISSLFCALIVCGLVFYSSRIQSLFKLYRKNISNIQISNPLSFDSLLLFSTTTPIVHIPIANEDIDASNDKIALQFTTEKQSWFNTQFSGLKHAKRKLSNVCFTGMQQNFNISTFELVKELDKLKDTTKSVHHEENEVSQKNLPKANATLHVIVIPHSHNDPGWLKTITEYFNDQTSHILMNMVQKMQTFPNMTFVWAESVFLDLWWNELEKPAWNENRAKFRDSIRTLIKQGRLEIVVGSWVVPDEANTHFISLVDQIIEGHWWLKEHLDVVPQYTWSLDPFGYSATLPYLYKKAGFKNSVILRVHNVIKDLIIKQNGLDFIWRQQWDMNGDVDMQTHLMPYRLYNIKHTCGPDTLVCRHYDFRLIPGETSESLAEPVTKANVENLAENLLQQYRLKANLFQHNVVLIPIGDDFRYDRPIEWDQQYENYMALFEYMNQRKDWNVVARFGTVSDFFNVLRQHYPELYLDHSKNSSMHLPILSGDFYPYSDNSNDYWTGYFTTRPYLKLLGRELEYLVRVAEMLNTHSMMFHLRWLSGKKEDMTGSFISNLKHLQTAHRALGLFQHHDAITGTSKYYVARDYEKYLYSGIDSAKLVIETSLKYLMVTSVQLKSYPSPPIWFLNPEKEQVYVKETTRQLLLFNPIGQMRTDIIRLTVDLSSVRVLNEDGRSVACQINPVWKSKVKISKEAFELAFVAQVPPFGYSSYTVIASNFNSSSDNCDVAYVKLFNSPNENTAKDNVFNAMPSQSNVIIVQNSIYVLRFSSINGLLQVISLRNSTQFSSAKVALEFLMYKSRGSGAYIFEPTGPAIDGEMDIKPVVRVIKGSLLSEVHIVQPMFVHRVALSDCKCLRDYAIEINNIVDLKEFGDKEIILRMITNLAVKNGIFYTDSNGFQMMKRQRLANYLNCASYYPMTTAAYIEDRDFRLTLLTGQPLGLGSHKTGAIEVMLDRRLSSDDGRGVGEGIFDNQPTPSRFYLVLEAMHSPFPIASLANESIPLLSPISQIIGEHLRNYVAVFLTDKVMPSTSSFSLATSSLPCHVSLVSLRCLSLNCMNTSLNQTSSNFSNNVAVVLRLEGVSCNFPAVSEDLCGYASQDNSVSLSSLFNFKNSFQARETHLNILHDINDNVTDIADVRLSLLPFHLHSYRLIF